MGTEGGDLEYLDKPTVTLMKSMGNDLSVVDAARVSTRGETVTDREWSESKGLDVEAGQVSNKQAGLINYLMRDRHGCYDSDTDVLTSQGWLPWPSITGEESLLTLDVSTGKQSYQRPLRVIHKPWDGEMVKIEGASLDLLVTPDHRMLAAPRTREDPEWGMHNAEQFHNRSYRVPLGMGQWAYSGNTSGPDIALFRLVGFFIGDGNLNSSVSFHLKKGRKIRYLRDQAGLAGLVVTDRSNHHYGLGGDSPAAVSMRHLAESCYGTGREKIIPRWILEHDDIRVLEAVLDGLMNSDGSVSARGKMTYSTTSVVLRDQIQELAVKLGTAATYRTQSIGFRHFGVKPVYSLTLYRQRNLHQHVGWTVADRERQVQTIHYKGMVHCVTVPNGVVYVRRNGKPLWCGNSPFEHNSMTFFVKAPLVVFWQLTRHRVGWSYNLESGRYRELGPQFYIPHRDRPLVQDGKPGSYEYVAGNYDQFCLVVDEMMKAYEQCWASYQAMLKAGICREVARLTLPFGTYYSGYATCNARSLMHFLSLRTKSAEARVKSSPQYEINQVADMMEAEWKTLMPVTHAKFVENGRVAP